MTVNSCMGQKAHWLLKQTHIFSKYSYLLYVQINDINVFDAVRASRQVKQ